MSGRIVAVTLDATGTLIHAPRLGGIYAEILRRHGYDVDPTEARELVATVWQELSVVVDRSQDRFSAHRDGARGWWRRFLERFCEHLGAPPPSRFAAAELFDRLGRAESWELFPDVEPALERLRERGLRLAVIANWDERLPRLLDELGLAATFETILTSQGAGVEKPHPLIFQTALGLLDLAPEQVLHVGDRPLEDVEGAAAVGFETVLLRRRGKGGIHTLAELMDDRRLRLA